MQRYVSVVVPFHNEEKSILPLYQELKNILGKIKKPYEIIFINDGSNDNSINIVSQVQKKDKNVDVISFKRNRGKAEALTAGFKKSDGKFIIQIDADLQDDPKYIPDFVSALEKSADLVVGHRIKRKDGNVRIIESIFFNFFVNLISNTKLHDSNCGFKGYKSEVVKKLKLKGGMHRFIPLIVLKQGGKITEIKIIHRARKFGVSNYGMGRIFEATADYVKLLLKVKFKFLLKFHIIFI